MIQLHIIAKNSEVINEIEVSLITKKYITGATVFNTVSSYENKEG